jgi:hypothetical protein
MATRRPKRGYTSRLPPKSAEAGPYQQQEGQPGKLAPLANPIWCPLTESNRQLMITSQLLYHLTKGARGGRRVGSGNTWHGRKRLHCTILSEGAGPSEGRIINKPTHSRSLPNTHVSCHQAGRPPGGAGKHPAKPPIRLLFIEDSENDVLLHPASLPQRRLCAHLPARGLMPAEHARGAGAGALGPHPVRPQPARLQRPGGPAPDPANWPSTCPSSLSRG